MHMICRKCLEPCKATVTGETKDMRCLLYLEFIADWVPDVDEQATVDNEFGTIPIAPEGLKIQCDWCHQVHDANMACRAWVEIRALKRWRLRPGGRIALPESIQGRRVGARNRRSPWVPKVVAEATERRLLGKGRRRADCP